jgi:drug/metabolite transporter (DMT)-like permease
MTHRQAVALMIACTCMWSISGIVSRQLEGAAGFEVAFWRSLFTTLALLPLLAWLRGAQEVWQGVRSGGPVLWTSACCWAVMFTAFMLALMLTTVANVLVTLALAPLLTAFIARYTIGHRLPRRSAFAIVLAGIGIVWMYGSELSGAEPDHLLGTAIAMAVPLAAAINWTLLQHAAGSATRRTQDMLPAVLLGAIIATLASLPLAFPFAATSQDVAYLALLGTVQLALPCVLAVLVARVLSAPEMSLFGLLEVVLGVTWVWLGGGETPTPAVLGGGGLVLFALLVNELLALRVARA